MVEKKEEKRDSLQNSDEPFLEILAEAVLENFEETDGGGDPFDSYVHSVRAHLQGDKNSYKARVNRGYKILINELSQHPVLPESSEDSTL